MHQKYDRTTIIIWMHIVNLPMLIRLILDSSDLINFQNLEIFKTKPLSFSKKSFASCHHVRKILWTPSGGFLAISP